MNMPLLDIQPRTLKFVVNLKNHSSSVVQLTNTTHSFVAFKVKTTSPKKYCVRPNVGVVAPKSSCEFIVIMQAFKELPRDLVCKDKFLIQSTVVPVETTDVDITASMFSKVEGKHIEEYKLRVTLVSPSESTELSPINGKMKQELKPDFDPANDLKAAKSDCDTSRISTETEIDPIRFHKDADDGSGIKLRNNSEAMDLSRDQGFTNGITSTNSVIYHDEPKLLKERDIDHLQKTNAQRIKAIDEFNLVKDIEEMKLKVNALDSKLKQADSTISKLMEERSISFQHRQSLQQELGEMRTKKIVKEVHIGFPLMFVCVVVFISIVIGYSSA